MGKALPLTNAIHRAATTATVTEMKRLHARDWHIEFGLALQQISDELPWTTQKDRATPIAVKRLHQLHPGDWLRVRDKALAVARKQAHWSPARQKLPDNPAYEVTCPYCSASPRERCRRLNGKTTAPHKVRIARAA